MFGNRIPSKSNNCRHADVLCLLFYVSDWLIYDIFNFGIRVPNMIAQKLKTGQSTQHELFNKVRLEKLSNSVKFSLHTYFLCLDDMALLPHGGDRPTRGLQRVGNPNGFGNGSEMDWKWRTIWEK